MAYCVIIRRRSTKATTRWMITQYAIGHCHFCCQGLQGIQALVGVVHGALELLILLLEGFLIVTESVVVAHFPEHPRIRPHRRRNAYGPDKRQYRKAMQYVRRHDKLLQLTWRRRDIKCIALTPHEFRAPQALLFDVCGRISLVPARTRTWA